MRRVKIISERRCHAHGGPPPWACKTVVHFMPSCDLCHPGRHSPTRATRDVPYELSPGEIYPGVIVAHPDDVQAERLKNGGGPSNLEYAIEGAATALGLRVAKTAGQIVKYVTGEIIDSAIDYATGNPLWRLLKGKFAKAKDGAKVVDAVKGTSVIGPRETYREFAKSIGANFLDVSDEAWTWAKNRKFLDEIITRGDDVVFAGKFDPKKLDPNSVLAKEINYLIERGYQWSDDFAKLIKP